MPNNAFKSCDTCGAAVVDEDKHAEWHRLGRLDPDDPLTRECPVCHVAPGEPCVSQVGRPTERPHVKR